MAEVETDEVQRPVLTVDEVANYLGISRGLAFQGVRDGSIPSIRVGRRILVSRVALMRMLDQTQRAVELA